MNLREYARDQECQIRAPCCNFDRATTVLAHLNGGGMALKKNDLLGAWSCSDCHDFVDDRNGHATATTRRLFLLEGMARTQEILVERGVIKW